MDWLIFVLNVQQAVFQDKNKYNNCQYIKTVYYRNEGVAQQRLTATGKVWRVWYCIVWDSSAVRLAGAMGHQSTLHKEYSGFVAPTLGWHISTFRGYQSLFSIRNPYINRFTNHFSVHSQPSYPQKVVLHSITARLCPRPYHFANTATLGLITRPIQKSSCNNR
jgi:hypothetical protein